MSTSILTTTVRPATSRDIPAILALHESCYGGESAKGFFLDHGEAGDLVSYINGPDRVCLFAETEEGEPVGFMQAGRPVECIDQVRWLRPEVRTGFNSRDHWHVDNVAVNPAFAGQGVGRLLYEALETRTGAATLSAYVVRSPKVNEASLAFHGRLGFVRAGEFSAENFCGVRDYASVLLFRGLR